MTVIVPFKADHMAVGLNLNGEGRNLKFGAIIDGDAARYIPREGIETGESGYKRLVTIGTGAKVDDLFGGESVLTKALWAKSGTKIHHSVQKVGVAHDSGLTLTATERNFFLEGRNGDVFTFNQVDSPVRLATASLLSDTDDDTGSLNVGAGTIDKFAATGSGNINGSSVTYSGKSGGTLTGLSGIPSGGVKTGDIFTQSSTPATFAIAKGTCGMIVEGSMIVAGVLGTENVAYYGAPSNLDNPEFLWDFTDNGAGAKIFENPIVAMLKGETLSYFIGAGFIESTLGFDIATNVLRTDNVSRSLGAYNARSVAVMGGKPVLLGKNRCIPVDIVLNDAAIPSAKVDEDFDLPIRPWLEQLDAEGQEDSAILDYDSTTSLLTIGGKINGQFRIRRFDARDKLKAFTPEDIRPVRSYTFFDGKSYFGNNTVDKVYLDNNGFTNDGFAIRHRWRTSRMEDKKGRREVYLNFLELDGFMSKGCVWTVKIYVDGNFTIPAYTVVLDDSSITSKRGLALGQRTPGLATPGGFASIIPTKKFPFKETIDLTGLSGEDFSIELVCSKLAAYMQWKSFLMEGDGIKFKSRDRF